MERWRDMDEMVDWLLVMVVESKCGWYRIGGMVETWNGRVAGVWRWNGGLAVAPDHVCAYRFRWDL